MLHARPSSLVMIQNKAHCGGHDNVIRNLRMGWIRMDVVQSRSRYRSSIQPDGEESVHHGIIRDNGRTNHDYKEHIS